ncbi:hypothetical protein EES43_19470 [Streptomyces sp. ADI96-02]|nr:hypothetical protein EES43_19470 [Streptomyces sp. ADI96-02]
MPQARGRLGARTTILAVAAGHAATGGNRSPRVMCAGAVAGWDMALQMTVRLLRMADCGTLDVVAHITATPVPPSMKSTRPSSSPNT